MDCPLLSCPQPALAAPGCPQGSTPTAPLGPGLVVASLEIGRTLAERGRVTFRAQGTCMFPCVQPGDVLQVETRSPDQVQPGDIAVFRKGTALFGHRVIARGDTEGRAWLVTRPDRSRGVGDDPSFAEDLLGIVTAIERAGRRAPLAPRPFSRLAALQITLWETWHGRLLPRLADGLAQIQDWRAYRRWAAAILNRAQPRLSYRVRVPLAGIDLYREMALGDFDINQVTWQARALTRWELWAWLEGQPTPAARVGLGLRPAQCPLGAGWQVDRVWVRVRYRGSGLDEGVIRQAEAVLARSGLPLSPRAQRGT